MFSHKYFFFRSVASIYLQYSFYYLHCNLKLVIFIMASKGTCCSAFNCSRKFNKEENIRFHSFPIKNDELLRRWLIAMRQEDFISTKHSWIRGDHFISTDYYPFSCYLLKTSVPSIFDFPLHLLRFRNLSVEN